jgi:hypothetical protein
MHGRALCMPSLTLKPAENRPAALKRAPRPFEKDQQIACWQ